MTDYLIKKISECEIGVNDLDKNAVIGCFLKNLWHYGNEEDIDGELPIIVFLRDGSVMNVRYIKYDDVFYGDGVVLKRGDILKFCYLSDLII